MTLPRFVSALVVCLAFLVAPVVAATVKVSVNGQGITDVQIAQRLALFKLEGKSGSKAAQNELINEALMVQEAAKIGYVVPESEIDQAFLQVARNIKVSASNLEKILAQQGVGLATLRDRLRANIAWNQVVATTLSGRVTMSDADLEKQAEAKLTAANSYDYILKEVLFIMPGGKGNASKRTAEAAQYK
ncbi:MAG: SurA N-terminal domain-containing protein, partial [Devosia sp.]